MQMQEQKLSPTFLAVQTWAKNGEKKALEQKFTEISFSKFLISFSARDMMAKLP